MISARVSVQFPGDWTESIGKLSVYGDIYTATLHKRQYMGLIRVHGKGERLEEALSLIENADYHTSTEVIEHRHQSDGSHATVLVTAELTEQTPFLVMLEHGYMPLDPTMLHDGREFFDLILRNRDRFIELVRRLEDVGEVTIERVVSDVETPTQPNPVAWSSLQEDLTDRQIEVLSLAIERGYFEIPRAVDLSDLAVELGVRKTTVGEHLRRSLGRIATFIITESDRSKQHHTLK
jgi:predicted DNA binding protein